MWDCTIETRANESLRYVLRRDAAVVSYRDVLGLWQSDDDFRAFFISLLAKSQFVGFRWETPPITAATADRPCEFVLLDAPRIDRTPDTRAFAEQFRSARAGKRVVAFPNLGNDAVLVVPLPTDQRRTADYVHLSPRSCGGRRWSKYTSCGEWSGQHWRTA